MTENQIELENQPDRVFSNQEILTEEEKLLRDKKFLIDVAVACDESYRTSEILRLQESGEKIPDWLKNPLFSPAEQEVLLSDPNNRTAEQKELYSKAQPKLATNLAGLYALQEGLGIAALMHAHNPHEMHDTIIDLQDGKADDPFGAQLFSRLAHATWAAGQPFRDRETRPVMNAFDNLSLYEQTKDIKQIVAASKVLKRYLDAAPPSVPVVT